MKSPSTRSPSGLQRHPFCRLRPLRFALEFSTIFTPFRFLSTSGFSGFLVSSRCCTLQLGTSKSSPVAFAPEDGFLSFSISMSRDERTEEYSRQRFLPKLVEPWLVSCSGYATIAPKGITAPLVSESPVRGSLPICQEVLDISQIAVTFHGIRPFFPDLIATVQQTSLLFFCVQFVQQYQSSRIDEVFKCDDTMIDLHRICQFPMNCQCKWLSAFLTARETLLNSVPFPLKFQFCTDMIATIELYHDCVSVIVSRFTFLTEDFIICCYQVIKLFSSRYCFASASSARSPTSQIRSFGKWVKILCFLGDNFVGRCESESWEMCRGAGTSVSSRFSVNSSKHSGRYRNRSPDVRL